MNTHRRFATRIAKAGSAIAAIASFIVIPASATAQRPPADLTVLPAIPTDFTPQKTAWGDYDFSGTFTQADSATPTRSTMRLLVSV